MSPREQLLDELAGLGSVKAETRSGVLLMCALEHVALVRDAAARHGATASTLSDRRARMQAVVVDFAVSS